MKDHRLGVLEAAYVCDIVVADAAVIKVWYFV